MSCNTPYGVIEAEKEFILEECRKHIMCSGGCPLYVCDGNGRQISCVVELGPQETIKETATKAELDQAVALIKAAHNLVFSPDQEVKADAGKAQISLVPMEIIWAIAWIRMYGNHKYGDPDNWKTVEPQRYRDALMRHLLHYISDPESVDEESGYPHLWHAACNMAFLMHMDYGDMCHYDFAVKKSEWEKIGKAIEKHSH